MQVRPILQVRTVFATLLGSSLLADAYRCSAVGPRQLTSLVVPLGCNQTLRSPGDPFSSSKIKVETHNDHKPASCEDAATTHLIDLLLGALESTLFRGAMAKHDPIWTPGLSS